MTLKKPPIYFNHKYKISYKIIEYENNLKNIKHPVVREMLKYLKFLMEWKLTMMVIFPQKTEWFKLFICCWINDRVNAIQRKKISKFSLAKESINFEQNIKRNSWITRSVAASYGGFNLIKFNKKNF